MSIIAVSIGISEGAYAWTGAITIDDIASYQQVVIGDPLTVTVGGEVFNLMVDSKTISRDGVNAPVMSLSVISPTAMLEDPYAKRRDLTMPVDTTAKAVAEAAINGAIEWDLVDWMIPSDLLSFYRATPLSIVRAVVSAAGGTVETLPDGMLRVRHLFPVPVPNWAAYTIPATHVLTDAVDNLSCTETYAVPVLVDKVSIRSEEMRDAMLSFEVDGRPNGLNGGITSFTGGMTAYFLLHVDPQKISEVTVIPSVGDVVGVPVQSYLVTQFVNFDQSRFQASLEHPTDNIVSVQWYGNNLGALRLGKDKKTVSPEIPGTGIAQVRYTVQSFAFGVELPKIVSDTDHYPVNIALAGEVKDLSELVCQRGAGNHPGEDVIDPFLTTIDAKLSRGRAIIDQGSGLQVVSLTCIHRPGIMPGDLVQIHDALMGSSWIGKVSGVRHNIAASAMTTHLEILRAYDG
ncbi:MAG: hypothetical protein HQL07_01360 [Nitrospirae bacterium]|nr:hypothetical protein [Magnetococcales bacterium]HAT51483.1 hypothetical protein [Alphaproteobacteria bacterium]